ncbi:MAG: hypothetical protein D3909_07805, partial [Candidatus Electrothrix sp. ATG1]|nr:hypothetical protein [Candidatus Electrothrix sp. ATG1]
MKFPVFDKNQNRFLPCFFLLSCFLITAWLSGCSNDKAQDGKELQITQAVFTRTGIYYQLSQPALIKEVRLAAPGGIPLVTVREQQTKASGIIDTDWKKNTKYILEVLTDSGEVSMPIFSPEKPTPVKIGEIPLKELERSEMEYRYYASRSAEVCFSPDSKYIGVGSKGGYVYVIQTDTQEILWQHKIAQGRVAKVAFTGNGRLVAGEESRDGFIYCFDAASGKMLWQYKAYDDFGNQGNELFRYRDLYTSYPLQAYGLRIDQENNPYLLMRYSAQKEIQGRQIQVSSSIVYKFDIESGQPLWKFPIKASAWGLDLSHDGKYVLPSIGWSKKPVLQVLDAASGTPAWEQSFSGDAAAMETFHGTTGFNASFSPDSHYVVVNQIYPDITFIFDNPASAAQHAPIPVLKKKFFPLIKAGQISIGVSAGNLTPMQNTMAFSTWSTRALGAGRDNMQPPSQHPDADTLFVHSYDGELQWKWKLGDGTWSNGCILSQDERYMAVPVGIVPESPFADPQSMGVYVFN